MTDTVSTARYFLTLPPTGRYFSPALPSDCFTIDFPRRAISPGWASDSSPSLARIIHEDFYCNRRYAATTSLTAGGLAAQSVNILSSIVCFLIPRGSARPLACASRRFRHDTPLVRNAGRVEGARNHPSTARLSNPSQSPFPLKGRPGRSSNARVERAPSERARSASRRTTRLPFHPLLQFPLPTRTLISSRSSLA